MDVTTLRVLQKIRSRSVLPQKRYGTDNAKPPRVLCMVYTSQVSHSSKLNAIVNTWAKDCDGFFAASNLTEPCLGAADLMHNGPETYDNMWQKVRSMWAYVYAHYIEDYDFFHICGDDTYFIADNLRQHLWSLHHNTSKPLFLGTPMRHKGSYFAAGGPGYTLNQAAAKLLVEQALDIFLIDNVDPREDVFASSLLEKIGIMLTHAMDKNGLLIYMHINPPTFVEKYSFKDNAKLLGIDKVSGATASIHVNYNRQGVGRTLYSDIDIAEVLYWRKISNTNNDGDGNDFKTTRRCRPSTYNTRWAGFGSTSPSGGTTCMCVAAIACCGMPACANGQIHARGTKPPRQSRRWPRLGQRSLFWGARGRHSCWRNL